MKVWVVVFGYHADSWIRAVFSSAELAQRFYEEHKESSEANEPQEFALDDVS
jgi:hypothetical protein